MKKNNDFILPILGAIFLGLSTWTLYTLVELQTLVGMMQQELLNIDKQFGRVYAFIDQMVNK